MKEISLISDAQCSVLGARCLIMERAVDSTARRAIRNDF